MPTERYTFYFRVGGSRYEEQAHILRQFTETVPIRLNTYCRFEHVLEETADRHGLVFDIDTDRYGDIDPREVINPLVERYGFRIDNSESQDPDLFLLRRVQRISYIQYDRIYGSSYTRAKEIGTEVLSSVLPLGNHEIRFTVSHSYEELDEIPADRWYHEYIQTNQYHIGIGYYPDWLNLDFRWDEYWYVYLQSSGVEIPNIRYLYDLEHSANILGIRYQFDGEGIQCFIPGRLSRASFNSLSVEEKDANTVYAFNIAARLLSMTEEDFRENERLAEPLLIQANQARVAAVVNKAYTQHRQDLLANIAQARDTELRMERELTNSILSRIDKERELESLPPPPDPEIAIQIFSTELERIRAMPVVTSVLLDSELNLKVKTIDLYCSRRRTDIRHIGQVELKINLSIGNGEDAVRAKNLTHIGLPAGCHFGRGDSYSRACWGTALRPMCELYARFELYDLIVYIISFIESPPGDRYGREHYALYPVHNPS